MKSRLRVGLSGPSGSGKTFSSLLIASGVASAWDKVALIDTENGSGDLYSHLGDYNIIRMEAPFTPERYIEAIKACEAAGMEVIVIDSVTHEWDGKGGVLELNESLAKAKYKGNTWAAWNETTPRHQAFIYAIVQSTCHIITTVRNKQDTVQVDGKVKKVGTKEIQREGFEYELTLNLNLDRETLTAIASKDRTGLFNALDPFQITKDTGEILSQWANEGKDPPPPPTPPKPIVLATEGQKLALRKYIVTNKPAEEQASAINFINKKMTAKQAYEKMVEYGILEDEPTKEELDDWGVIIPPCAPTPPKVEAQEHKQEMEKIADKFEEANKAIADTDVKAEDTTPKAPETKQESLQAAGEVFGDNAKINADIPNF